jgi:hypothetical protein
MEPGAYNVVSKVHTILSVPEGKQLTADEIAYITGMLEALLEQYGERSDGRPPRAHWYQKILP